MSTLTLTKVDVILQFESPKKKTHKVHMNNAPSRTFLKMLLGQRN